MALLECASNVMIAREGGRSSRDDDIVLVTNVRNTVSSGRTESGDFFAIFFVSCVCCAGDSADVEWEANWLARLWTEETAEDRS